MGARLQKGGIALDRTIYSAPLEGLTGFVWRKAQAEVFGGIDKYYTPFIVPTINKGFANKELRDISQNEEHLIPQLLTNNAEAFISVSHKLAEMNYDEINLNLGCPSGTVVPKGRGAGALKDLDKLDALLDEVFTSLPDFKISIKTRIGLEDEGEWPAILALYERYPIHELTIHPRVRSQFYKGSANRALFLDTFDRTGLPLVYNGDITNSDDEAFEYACPVMIGRGLIANPALARLAKGGNPASREELLLFHRKLIEGYSEYFSGDVHLVRRMKEFWHYYRNLFDLSDAQFKRLLKTKRLDEFTAAAESIITGCELMQERI